MILRFDFEYVSTSLVYEKLLIRSLKEYGLNGKLTKNGDMLSLFVDTNEEELKKFADHLSKELPYSIFLKRSDVQVVDSIPKDSSYQLPKYPKRELPFCPKCLKEAIKNYDPFVECEVCGYGIKKSELIYKNFAKELRGNNKEIFENVAKVLKNGAVVKVKTFNGYKKIALLDKKNFLNFKDDFELLFKDVQLANKALALKKGGIIALGSFEKPTLKASISKEFLKKYPFFESFHHIKVRVSDDLILELILNEISKITNPILMIKDIKEDEKFYVSVDFDAKVRSAMALEVMVLSDGKILMINTEKGVVPKVNENFSSLPIVVESNRYKAINTDRYIITYTKDKKLPEVKNHFILGSKERGFEASYGAFYSIIAENNLFDKTLSGVYISRENSDKVMIYSKKFGLVEYLQFGYKFPNSINELFSLIQSEDETSNKLVKNFLSKVSIPTDIFMKFEKMGDIYKLWGVIGIVLKLFDGDDVKASADLVIDASEAFRGKKGPRIDYKLIRVDGKPRLDILKVIKTAMSFRLAGIDKETLCFGIVESFAEFLSNLVDDINQDYMIDGVCMNGSSFSSEKFTEKFYTITSKNYQIYTNKEFGLDDINLCYGMISGLTKKI